MFYGNSSSQIDAVITRSIVFPQPVVTSKFKLILQKAASSVVFKMDLIGMPSSQKYRSDAVFDSIPYEDGKQLNLRSSNKLIVDNINM